MMNKPVPIDMSLLVMDRLAQLAGPLKQKQVEGRSRRVALSG